MNINRAAKGQQKAVKLLVLEEAVKGQWLVSR